MGPDPQIMHTARIGVIGDTHGYLDPAVLGWFAEVDHVIHCGDIGDLAILAELEKVGDRSLPSPETSTTGTGPTACPRRCPVKWRVSVSLSLTSARG